MQSQLVFQEKNEIKRLRVQNSLLSAYEDPIFAQIFSEVQELMVLDIGCNDGSKTVERFSSNTVSKVVGLEYNADLVIKAQKKYGNEHFSFYQLDVEDSDFANKLREIMSEKTIRSFDVIYLSFVLMHLKDTKKLLCALQTFLSENGKILIIEANDSASTLSNDTSGLLSEYFDILKKDKYSGNREAGRYICETLCECGYENIRVWQDSISAGIGEKEKKKAIFTTFFSYLPEDVKLLSLLEPDNEDYKKWALWIDEKYKILKRLILQEKSEISMGMKFLTCTRSNRDT